MLECDGRASLSLPELYLQQQRVGKALELTLFAWSHRGRGHTGEWRNARSILYSL